MNCPKCENTDVDISDINEHQILFDQYQLKCQCYECGYSWSVDCQAEIIRVNK
jgi:hypothetical protein